MPGASALYDQVPIAEIANVLAHSQRLAVTCHRQPDGDALGASLAVALALRAAGKDVSVFLPTAFGRQYQFLPGIQGEWVEVAGDPNAMAALPEFDALLVLDVDVGDRLLAVQHVRRKQTLVIDHHASSTAREGDLTHIDATSPCTGMLVEVLLDSLDAPLTPDIAMCLYTALSFDTGRFMHSNTTPAVFRAAARYQEAGCDATVVNRHLAYSRTETDIKAQSAGLQRLVIDGKEPRIAGIVLPHDAIQAVGDVEDWGELVEWPRSIRGVEVAYLIREQQQGVARVSLRANPPYVINGVAERFSGGGHQQAAGCTIFADAVAAAKELLPELRKITQQVSESDE